METSAVPYKTPTSIPATARQQPTASSPPNTTTPPTRAPAQYPETQPANLPGQQLARNPAQEANQPAGALTLPPLCDEPAGRNIPTLASHFAELDDADIAATATTWRNTAAALHDYAARLHQAATSIAHAGTHAGTNAITNADIYGGTRADTYGGTHSVTPGSTHIDAHGAETFATSQGIHEWADGLEEFARRSETIAQRIDSFAATYTTTRTQLADIATRREEALEQPAFQTYTFPEVAFTSRADQLLRDTYNPGIQQATLAGISFPCRKPPSTR
ncbi:MAG: hypothetical protein U1U88_001278 [Lawsonella clevelandensis]